MFRFFCVFQEKEFKTSGQRKSIWSEMVRFFWKLFEILKIGGNIR